MKKKVLFAAAFMLATVGAYAQGNGIAGITEATNMVTSYFDQVDLRSGSRSRSHRWCKGLFEVLFGRPRHLENRSLLVRCLYLPDCSRHYLTFILPLIWRSIKSTKGLVVAPSSRGYAANTSSSSPAVCSPYSLPLWCCIWQA